MTLTNRLGESPTTITDHHATLSLSLPVNVAFPTMHLM
jgi:hypothetical protein